MGKEKQEGKHNNASSEGKSNEKEEEQTMIVLKVDMHCDACAKKAAKSLRGFQGVEDILVDRKTSTIGVKGKNVDPMKLCERIQSKTGRKAQVISPLPKPEEPKDENVKNQKKEEVIKDQPPPVVTVVLRVQMHCEACAQLLRKRIRKMKGVESVDTDLANGLVVVKGIIPDPEDLAKYVYKRTRKQVSIVKDEEKKQEDKKDSDHGEGVKKEEDKTMTADEMNRYEYNWPTARYNYMEHHNYLNSTHQPQFFSDENPNACSIM